MQTFVLILIFSFDPCNRIRNPESGKIWLLESGIHNDGIRNPDLIWNPESNEFRIRNPEGWNPESSGSESGIQMVGIRNPEPLWILLHGSIQLALAYFYGDRIVLSVVLQNGSTIVKTLSFYLFVQIWS